MVNMLGSPARVTCHEVCKGCEYERQEAVCEGLIVLGYLDPPKYRLVKVDIPGACRHFEYDGPQPDPVDAWRRFMKGEFGVEVPIKGER